MFKKQAIAALITGSALALSVVSVAPAVHAASLTPGQVNAVIGLLQSFGVEQSTIANVQAVLSGTSVSSTTGSVGGSVLPIVNNGGNTPRGEGIGLRCAPGLMMNLRMGARGSEVSKLQEFLKDDEEVFPNGQVTGFFGPATRDAVRRWQIKNGVVSASTATSSTGFVGPATRGMIVREMERRCHEKQGTTTPPVVPTTTASN